MYVLTQTCEAHKVLRLRLAIERLTNLDRIRIPRVRSVQWRRLCVFGKVMNDHGDIEGCRHSNLRTPLARLNLSSTNNGTGDCRCLSECHLPLGVPNEWSVLNTALARFYRGTYILLRHTRQCSTSGPVTSLTKVRQREHIVDALTCLNKSAPSVI